MSVRSALTVVGTVVGAYFGSPQLGYAIGSLVGSAVDPQVIPGPKVGEVVNQTAQEGGPRPIVFGVSQPLSPNVIAQGPPRIVKSKKRQGKGGPKVETETLYRTYAVGICEGPVDGIARVWRNNTLVYDATDAPLVGAAENAAFLSKARFFLGDYAQLPSPDLEAIFGVGSTPAHRGTAYMVMVDEDLTDMRGAIPQWVFLVQGTRLQQRWVYDVAGEYTWEKPARLVSIDIQVLGAGGGGAAGRGSISGYPRASGGGGGGYVRGTIDEADISSSMTVTVGAGGSGGARALATTGGVQGAAGDAGGQSSFGDIVIAHGGQGGIETGITNPSSGGGGSITLPPPVRITGTTQETGGGSSFASAPQARVNAGAHGGWGYNDTSDGPFGTTTDVGGLGVLGHGGGGGAYAFNADASAGTDGSINGCGGGGGGLCEVDSYNNNLWYSGAGGRGGDGAVIIEATYEPGTKPGSLVETVTAICERAGLPAGMIDTSELAGMYHDGFTVTNSYMAIDALRSLGQAFLFDVTTVDGKVTFVLRGKNSVATVPAADFVDEEGAEDDESSMRDDSIVVPRVLNMIYFDVASGMAPSKQTSERAGDRRSQGDRTIQVPVNMDSVYAAQLCAVTHKTMVEDQRGTVRLVLHDGYIRLVPTDVIIAPVAGVNQRLRIQRCDIYSGYQVYECVHDRQSAYTSNVEGIPAVPPTAPPSSLVGATLVAVLDVSFLRDQDDAEGSGYYVAVGAVSDAWRGATVEVSYDGGATYDDSQSGSTAAVFGTLATALPDHPQDWTANWQTCDIAIEYSYSELEATDYAGVLNRYNLAAIGTAEEGYELVNFQNATEVSPGVWRIGKFLRGRKGTQTRGHAIGETFVLLDRQTLTFVPESVGNIGRVITLRATSIGAPATEFVTVDFQFMGNVQRERAPSRLMAEIDGSNLNATWIGVGRYGGSTTLAHGAYFAGYRATVYAGGEKIELDTQDTQATIDISALSGDIYLSVQQVNSLTGPGPAAWWPSNPSELADEEHLALLGLTHPFDSGVYMGRVSYTNYRVDVESYNTTSGIIKYPADASGTGDRQGNSSIGEPVYGFAKPASSGELLYVVSTVGASVGFVRRLDVGAMVVGDTISNITTAMRGANYLDVVFVDGDLYASKTTQIDRLDPTSLAIDASLVGGGAVMCRFLLNSGSDLWICERAGVDEGRILKIDKTTGAALTTIETRRFPIGGVIYGSYAYVYCLNNGAGPGGVGIFKYRLSDGAEIADWANAADTVTYGNEQVAVWFSGTRMAVAWAGHKVFDLTTESYI